MAHAQLPISSLPLWQSLNNVVLSNTRIAAIPGKGSGLVAVDSSDHGLQGPLISVPHDLVLNAEAVEEYAKQDRNFRLLLDAAGHKSPRGDILLFLLVQVVLGSRQPGEDFAALPTPWTEYARFLPVDVPLPTLWTDPERLLLQGTSLESAIEAKLIALEHEFDELRERSSDIPFWQAAFWERESGPQLRHWFIVDAWYRSRCLELPKSGSSMIPCIDMVNHSATPNAYYEESSKAAAAAPSGEGFGDNDNDVVLLLRPHQHVAASEEITISYSGMGGESDLKRASEMLFSYGFVDPKSTRHNLVVPCPPFLDDPLAKAKLHVFGTPAPRLEIERLSNSASSEDGHKSDEDNDISTVAGAQVRWTCPFLYLMCVNEEDGIDFRLRQETDGSTQLRMFWQDTDVTDSARDFEALTRTHDLAPVIQLRVITFLQEIIEWYLERMQTAGWQSKLEEEDNDDENNEKSDDKDMADTQSSTQSSDNGDIRSGVAIQAARLRDIESRIFSSALEALEAERADLCLNPRVVAYLELAGASQNNLPQGEMANREETDEPMGEDVDDDFS